MGWNSSLLNFYIFSHNQLFLVWTWTSMRGINFLYQQILIINFLGWAINEGKKCLITLWSRRKGTQGSNKRQYQISLSFCLSLIFSLSLFLSLAQCFCKIFYRGKFFKKLCFDVWKRADEIKDYFRKILFFK